METSFKYSPSSSTPSAIKHVTECMAHDSAVHEYFDILTEYGDVFQNYQALKGTDIAKLSNVSPFPPAVTQIKTGKIGFLEQVNRFYCINGKKIIFWKQGSAEIEKIQEEETEIIAVSCFSPNHKDITKNVKYLLAISTPTYIKMYALIDDILNTEIFFVQETDFSAFSLSPGPKHTLLAGSHNGNVYIIKIEKNQTFLSKLLPTEKTEFSLSPKLKNATSSIATSIIPDFLKFREHAIIQLSFDPTTNILATLDDDSNIKFYSCSENVLNKVGSYSSGNSPIVTINYIPSSDSKLMRFVAFNKKAQRLFFGYSKRIVGKSLSISLQFVKNPPPDIDGNDLVSGAYSLGTYVLVYKTGVFVIRSTNNGVYEEVFVPELIKCSGCLVFPLRHPLDFLSPTPIFKDPTMWQHIIEPPSFVIINVDGTAFIDSAVPNENLYRCLTESHGGISQDVKAIIGEALVHESMAAALIFAQSHPCAMTDIIQASTILKQKGFKISESIFIRASRFLGLINELVPFENNKVSKAVLNLPYGFISNLKGFVNVIHSLNDLIDSSIEKSELSELCELLEIAAEIITLLQIVGTQEKVAIEKALSRVSISEKMRLKKAIGGTDPIIDPLRNFLREFVNYLQPSPELDLLSAQICTECKHITSYEAVIRTQADTLLNNAAELPIEDRASALRQAASAYCELCQKSQAEMTIPIRRFIELGAPALAVEVALAWRNSVDPYHRALDWFEGYCVKTDAAGFAAFQKVYKCYSSAVAASEYDEGIDAIIRTDDKLFIFTAFEHISSDMKKLLSIKSPYLEDYLKNNKRKKLWEYYAKTDKSKAADELIHLAADGDKFTMEERIRWLTDAVKQAKEVGNMKLKQEAESLLACAKLSMKLRPVPEVIMSAPEIANLAKQTKQFGVALETYSYLNDLNSCIEVWKLMIQTDPTIVGDVIRKLPHGILANEPRLVVPFLEDTRVSLQESYLFAIDILVDASIDLKSAAETYVKLIETSDPSGKASLVCSALRLLSLGFGDKDKLLKFAKEFENDASYGKDVKNMMP